MSMPGIAPMGLGIELEEGLADGIGMLIEQAAESSPLKRYAKNVLTAANRARGLVDERLRNRARALLVRVVQMLSQLVARMGTLSVSPRE